MSFNAVDNNLSTNLILATRGQHYNYNTPRKCQAENRRRRKDSLKPIMKPSDYRY